MSSNLKDNTLEWLFIKIPFILFSTLHLASTLMSIQSISSSEGICQLFNCNLFLLDVFKFIIIIILIIFSILYFLEKRMLISTFGIFCICLLIYWLHESFGVSNRTGIITLIWFSQFLAYLSYKINKDIVFLQRKRIFYPVQVIVACYTLSAISKILTSGFGWFKDAHFMVLQMLKSNQMKCLDGIIPNSDIMSAKIDFVIQYEGWIVLLLVVALLIELTSGLALLNNKMRLIYGLLLLSLHIGINFFFGILIDTFYKSMIIFMINPFYLIYLLINKTSIFRLKII